MSAFGGSSAPIPLPHHRDDLVGPGPGLRIDNHFPVKLGLRRPTRPTHNDPCSPAAHTSAGAIASRRASQLPAD